MSQWMARPVVMGRRGAVTAGHYLAAGAGVRILQDGGNAIDAAAATCFCLNVLEPHMNGLGGEVPTLIYSARDRRVYAVSGMGWSPRKLTLDWCRTHGVDLIPGDGYIPACVPSVIGTWGEALARFGTMSWRQVLAPAIELARSGFPVFANLAEFLRQSHKSLSERYPTTAAIYYPGGRVPPEGEVLANPDLADTLQAVVNGESAAAGRGREAGLAAGMAVFYEGRIAERIVRFIQQPLRDTVGHEAAGLLTEEDMAMWRPAVEEPVCLSFRGLQIHKCGPWTQGPVFLQQLAMLDGFDLAAMGHNSADYLHTYLECAKLAFADREAYYGDPLHDSVPLDVLLSPAYADQRRKLVGPEASREMRPGNVGAGVPTWATGFDVAEDNRRALGAEAQTGSSGEASNGDTTHLDVVDAEGNMVSATPSGGWIQSSPVIPGLGFCLGTRAQMFYLNPRRPNAVAGHKRPRATLTPSLATRDGRPYMVFGTPGGDSQDQTTLQFLLNHVVFGMDVQAALEAPLVESQHFPSSFYPRRGQPARAVAENRVSPEVIEALRRRGHDVSVVGSWNPGSKAMAIRWDAERGVMHAGVSPRRQVGYAVAW